MLNNKISFANKNMEMSQTMPSLNVWLVNKLGLTLCFQFHPNGSGSTTGHLWPLIWHCLLWWMFMSFFWGSGLSCFGWQSLGLSSAGWNDQVLFGSMLFTFGVLLLFLFFPNNFIHVQYTFYLLSCLPILIPCLPPSSSPLPTGFCVIHTFFCFVLWPTDFNLTLSVTTGLEVSIAA